MYKITALLLAMIMFAFSFGLMACDEIKDEVNERSQQTKNISMNITDDYIPLLAAAFQDYQLTSLCYSQPISFDALISDSEYADWWDDIKGHIEEVVINSFDYKLANNISTTNGGVNLYIVDEEDLPDPIAVPQEVLDEFFGDDLPAYFVDPANLSADDHLATIPIQVGVNVPDWTEINWEGDGEKQLEELMVNFEKSFSFCLELAVPPTTINSLDDINPTAYTKLRIDLDVIFVPLK